MEMPPPYKPKKSNTGLIVGLIIGGVLLCCLLPVGLIGGGIWMGVKQVGPIATCGMAIEDLQTAVEDYAKDHDGKLPTASKWMDELRPYYEKVSKRNNKEENPFGVMPAAGEWGCESDGTKTGFAFNSDLSAKALSEIQDKSTPVIFETPKRSMNLNMPYKPQDGAQSPKMFGERRGWFVVPVEGSADLIGASGKRARFETGRDR